MNEALGSSGDRNLRYLVAAGAAAAVAAALALVFDSFFLLLFSVGLLGLVGLGAFALGLTEARQRDFTLPFVSTVVLGLALAAVATAAIVVGSQDDAPGLVLIGSAVIATVIVGALLIGMRTRPIS
jgi:hypothetical protein